jgi:hypothetical protein
MLLLPKNVSALVRLAATPGTAVAQLGAIAGVRLIASEGGYRAEATNGKVLGIVTGPVRNPDWFPDSAIPPAAADSATEAVVLPEAWKEALKGLPARPATPALGDVAVLLGPDGATLVTTDGDNVTVTDAPRPEGRFPDVEKPFPREAPTARFAVDPALLRTLLAVAEAFTDQQGQKRVVFEVWMPKAGAGQTSLQPIQVTARNDAGQEFRGLIVPLSH